MDNSEKILPPYEFFLFSKESFIRLSESIEVFEEARHKNIVDDFDRYIELLDVVYKLKDLSPENKNFPLFINAIHVNFLKGFHQRDLKEKNIYSIFEKMQSEVNVFLQKSSNLSQDIKNKFRNLFPEIVTLIEDPEKLRDLKLNLYLEYSKLEEVLDCECPPFLKFFHECIEEQQKFLRYNNSKDSKKAIIEIEENPFSNEENLNLFNFFNQWFKPSGSKAKYSYILEHFQKEREKQLLEKPFFEFIERVTKTKISKRKHPSANNQEYFKMLNRIEQEFIRVNQL